ncbi:MAG: hypothetical protein WCO56_03935 [Verrucomicrobiota bacterium]
MPALADHLARLPLFGSTLPDLRPIEELLPPTIWEQYGGAILLVGLLSLLVLATVVWWCRGTRSVVTPSPADIAREALRKLEFEPDGSALAGSVLQTLRHYLPAVIPMLPRGELTADEIAGQLSQQSSLTVELKDDITALLRQCERRQFDARNRATSPRLVADALLVVGKIETARVKRQDTPPLTHEQRL